MSRQETILRRDMRRYKEGPGRHSKAGRPCLKEYRREDTVHSPDLLYACNILKEDERQYNCKYL